MLKEFNLHTIVRLGSGAFAPYTDIPTNLLFFDRGGPTREVWYYEVALPDGKKKYSKTAPMLEEEFQPAIDWWMDRKESDRAWRVPIADIEAGVLNLDIKNPRGASQIDDLPPEQIIERMMQSQEEVAAILRSVREVVTRV